MKIEDCANESSFIWSSVIYMRHVQPKHIWGCSQLKPLQPLEKNHHSHLRRSKLAYPICQEFTGLLPKPLYHSLLHIAVWYECLAVFRMFEHLPSLGCLLALHSVDHMWTDIVVQQCDAIGEFPLMFVLYHGPQLMMHSKVMVCIDCVVMWFDILKLGSSDILLVLLQRFYHLVCHL